MSHFFFHFTMDDEYFHDPIGLETSTIWPQHILTQSCSQVA